MIDAQAMVQQFIDNYYRTTIGGVGTLANLYDSWLALANKYPHIVAEAERRLAELNELSDKLQNRLAERCFISAQAHEFLKQALDLHAKQGK